MLAPRPINRFIYPRTISVRRPNSQRAAPGGQANAQTSQPGGPGKYRGTDPATATSGPGETTVLTGIPCSIQSSAGRVTQIGELPSDAGGPIRWRVYIPLSAAAAGSIKERDIVVDDFGNRYQVSAAYPASLGFRLETIRLEN